jgi:hypothetical protein
MLKEALFCFEIQVSSVREACDMAEGSEAWFSRFFQGLRSDIYIYVYIYELKHHQNNSVRKGMLRILASNLEITH